MSNSYLVQLYPPIGGFLILGAVEAESQKEAQENVAHQLETFGVLNCEIAREVRSYRRLFLKHGFEIRIAPIPSLEKLLPVVVAQVSE